MEYKVYVGNLNYGATNDDLSQFFQDCGEIDDIAILSDRVTGKARGFGFVTFKNKDGMDKAIAMNGSDMMGRSLKICQAEQKQRGSFGGGRGDRDGFGGGRGGRGRHDHDDR